MAWNGYFEFGGTEIINAPRVEEYAKNAGLFALRPYFKNDALGLMLGEVYDTPLQDDAPWCDPDDLDTYDFLGVYPLEVAGIDDSTYTSQVTESTKDGGVASNPRYASKTVVFNVALLGTTQAGVEAGLSWLKVVLANIACSSPGQACFGVEMCYLSSEPMLDTGVPTGTKDLTACLDPYLRSLHQVVTTVAPVVNAKNPLPSGGEVWLVSFTVNAGWPFTFGAETPLIEGFNDPNVLVPYVGGVVPVGGGFDTDGFVQTEVFCPSPTFQPIFDPLCPQIVVPPTAPNITLACFDFPVNYLRRQFIIPKTLIPLWGEVVPLLRIKAIKKEIRNLRVRFYADVFDTGDPNIDPCNFCGDIVFSYVPANSTLIFDGTDEQVYVEDPRNGRRRADSLVFGSDGGPFEWPQLSCGFSYIVTLDQPQTATAPVVDFSLYSRAA